MFKVFQIAADGTAADAFPYMDAAGYAEGMYRLDLAARWFPEHRFELRNV